MFNLRKIIKQIFSKENKYKEALELIAKQPLFIYAKDVNEYPLGYVKFEEANHLRSIAAEALR